MAFLSASKLQLELQEKQLSLSGRIITHFSRRRSQLTATLLIGNILALVLFSLGIVRVLHPLLLTYLPAWLTNDLVLVLLETSLTALLALTVGEFLPRSLFVLRANTLLQTLALPLLITYYVLYPVVFLGRSEGEEIGLRLFFGRRSASVSSSDLSDEALAALVERAAAMAREAPEDEYSGLAPENRLLNSPGVDVDGADRADPSPVRLKALALAIEDSARAVPGITNSEGAGVSAGRSIVALATSHGFVRGYETTGYAAMASVVAGTGAGMQRDYAVHNVRHFEDLEGPETLGRRAGERAVKRLDPGKLASGRMSVVFDPRVGSSLIGHLIGAMTGPAIARRTSFLLGREEEQLFAPGIVIRDDPHRLRGLASKPFDGEGLPTAPRDLIADGRISGWLLDSASARQLGLEPTGHATRGSSGVGAGATNVHMAAGSLSPAELIADIADGLYVTELIGQGVNPVTGDYSRGASGFRIEKGKITGPVAEITIAGNLIDMYRALTPANDLEFRRATNVPTLRIDGMMVAGA